jgi:HK97 family phage portal protein
MLKGFQFGGSGVTSQNLGDSWLRGVYDLAPVQGPFTANPNELDTNAVVMACVNWIMRTFPEAPLQVKRYAKDGDQVDPKHALTRLVKYPNPYYSGLTLWQATVCDYNISGNAYWLKLRNGEEHGKRVLQLWYEPSTTIRPVGTDKEFITHYEVYRNGSWMKFGNDRDDVVHFQFAISPTNMRIGRMPLAAALREVYTDEQAQQYTAALLRNMGVPGVMISPKQSAGITVNEAEKIKDLWTLKTTGERRGEALVWTEPLDVTIPAFSPENMNLRELRKIPQENISGMLGVAAIVAGLGAGLDRSTFANMAEAREYSYEGNIIPTGSVFAATLDTRLLPDLGDQENEYTCFDYSNVRVLQEDRDKLYARELSALLGSGIKLNEFRSAIGKPPDPDGDVYYFKQGQDGVKLVQDLAALIDEQDMLAQQTLAQGDQALEAGDIQNEAAQSALEEPVEEEEEDEEDSNVFTLSWDDDIETKATSPKKPGSRGGQYWIDERGRVRYGKKPTGKKPRKKKPKDPEKEKRRAALKLAKQNVRDEIADAAGDMEALERNGWDVVDESAGGYTEEEATNLAREAAANSPDALVAVVEDADGNYHVVSKPLKDLQRARNDNVVRRRRKKPKADDDDDSGSSGGSGGGGGEQAA